MYYSIGLFAAFITAMANLNQSEIILTSENEPKAISLDISSGDTEKFKPGKDMVSMNPLRGICNVKLGQQIYYGGSVHGSVGSTVSVYSSDSEALPLNRSFIEYDKKQQRGMTGGDSATKYFIFDASKAGTYEVYVKRYFRGDLENEFTITINVE